MLPVFVNHVVLRTKIQEVSQKIQKLVLRFINVIFVQVFQGLIFFKKILLVSSISMICKRGLYMLIEF